MGHSKTCEAIILQTYDVGEADRFCILLTREHGRLAARARGVRKLSSRMGGSLLPLHCCTVDLHEGSAGFLITGVHANNSARNTPTTIQAFMRSAQGIELILKLIEDGEELPDVFDLTKEFLNLSALHHAPVLPFTIRLLALLGLLPMTEDNTISKNMTDEEKVFFKTCTGDTWKESGVVPIETTKRIQRLCENIIGQQNSRELKAAVLAKTMALSS